jgi:hypothetical protein
MDRNPDTTLLGASSMDRNPDTTLRRFSPVVMSITSTLLRVEGPREAKRVGVAFRDASVAES